MLFFFKKVLAVQKKVVILHRICGELSCGVTVAHRILVPFAWVRILPGQQTIRSIQLSSPIAGHHEMVDLLKGLVRITQTLILLQ